jgi:hypothetical protein
MAAAVAPEGLDLEAAKEHQGEAMEAQANERAMRDSKARATHYRSMRRSEVCQEAGS